jgi:hypothetical protein
MVQAARLVVMRQAADRRVPPDFAAKNRFSPPPPHCEFFILG